MAEGRTAQCTRCRRRSRPPHPLRSMHPARAVHARTYALAMTAVCATDAERDVRDGLMDDALQRAHRLCELSDALRDALMRGAELHRARPQPTTMAEVAHGLGDSLVCEERPPSEGSCSKYLCNTRAYTTFTCVHARIHNLDMCTHVHAHCRWSATIKGGLGSNSNGLILARRLQSRYRDPSASPTASPTHVYRRVSTW